MYHRSPHRYYGRTATLRRVVCGLLLCAIAGGQTVISAWQEDVRKCAEAQDWTQAMRIVDREIARAPQDLDIRGWRARVLTWSGKLAEAELAYRDILAVSANDPDNWVGLANVYSREDRSTDALYALDRAVALDPRRADIRVARAREMRAVGAHSQAKMEFKRALDLDPRNVDGRAGIISLRAEGKHELRVAVNTGLFSFADANQDQGLTISSKWTPHWSTSIAADGYHWGGRDAEKVSASLTGRSPTWGALTVGGGAAHDNGVIPRDEGFLEYDQGFKLGRSGPLRGIEIIYGQHWYWYATARILTLNEMAVFYLPREWTWSVGLIEARSHFSQTGADWRPSGVTRLGFPISGREERRLGGNVFFAVGREDFAQFNQIGEFSSHTYGGGLRFQFTALQDVTGFAAYQRRSQSREESSFGFTYGLRF
jgi:tetratricopeptide (TPR) repeat protein